MLWVNVDFTKNVLKYSHRFEVWESNLHPIRFFRPISSYLQNYRIRHRCSSSRHQRNRRQSNYLYCRRLQSEIFL